MSAAPVLIPDFSRSQSSLALPFPFLVDMLFRPFRPFGFITSSSAYASSFSSLLSLETASTPSQAASLLQHHPQPPLLSEALGCVDLRPLGLGPTLRRDGVVSFANISSAGA